MAASLSPKKPNISESDQQQPKYSPLSTLILGCDRGSCSNCCEHLEIFLAKALSALA